MQTIENFGIGFVSVICCFYEHTNLPLLWTENNPHHYGTPPPLVRSLQIRIILVKCLTMFLAYITHIWAKKNQAESEGNSFLKTSDSPCFHIPSTDCLPEVYIHFFLHFQGNFLLLREMSVMLLLLSQSFYVQVLYIGKGGELETQ